MKKVWNFLVNAVNAVKAFLHITPKQTLKPSSGVNENMPKITKKRTAREIMGKNFFGIEEAKEHFKINPTAMQLIVLTQIPYTEEMLDACKNTHILRAIFPISIEEIRVMYPRLFRKDIKALRLKGKLNKGVDGEVFWCLIRKSALPGSYFDDPQMQRAVLGKNNVIPSARVMVCTIIGHYLATGEKLFSNSSIHFDQNSKDRRVVVGPFTENGLAINYYGTSFRPSYPGTCMAKKAEKVLVL